MVFKQALQVPKPFYEHLPFGQVLNFKATGVGVAQEVGHAHNYALQRASNLSWLVGIGLYFIYWGRRI